jgi:hypothetical protein
MRWICLWLGLSVVCGGAERTVTFHKDVEPVLQKHCQGCHRPGEIGPMSFLTYESARPWAKAMKQSVAAGKMPPWHAAPGTPHKFANDRRLKPEEVEVLRAWADTGAVKGDAKDAPRPARFTEGWSIGKPELTMRPAKAFAIPAGGTVEYTYYIFPEKFEKDTWVTELELRPQARGQVHHIIAYVRPPGSSWLKGYPKGEYFVPTSMEDREQPAQGERVSQWREFLIGYAPGYGGLKTRPGAAKLIAAGSEMVFELHYTTNGKAAEDASTLGLVLAKETPQRRALTDGAVNSRFEIPAGASDYRAEAAVVIQEPATLMLMNPHMHLRGKAFEFRAVYPDGRKEVLLSVPKYDFNWQTDYLLADPIALPKGTRIECTAWWDNSANNPFNPDPGKPVRWGDQSWEEMMVGFFELEFDRKLDPSDVFRKVRVRSEPAAGGR